MDRDATAAADVLPPVEWATVQRTAVVGFGLCAAAALIGLTGIPELNPVRLWAVFIGAVAGGLAISARPDLIKSWLLGAAVAVAGIFGSPAHWDSLRLLFGVIAFVALVRAGLLALSETQRRIALSVIILFHFFGILLATTSPTPTPWMVDQLYRRVYEPYLHFVYLRNAYHFYSPEPGPAAIVVCLIKTREGNEIGPDGTKRPKYKTRWYVLPRRSAFGPDAPSDVKDPLGVSYFRRLSLTDAVSHTGRGMTYETFEASDIRRRRNELTISGSTPTIPLHPRFLPLMQYRQPSPHITHHLLPSYAQHILMEEVDEKDWANTTVKIYRIEHRTLDIGGFLGLANNKKGGDPYHPATYYPYFFGEFGFVKDSAGNTKVDLLDPREPMLYWLVPIIENPGGTPGDPDKKDHIDYFSVHAGSKFDWSQLK